MGAKVNRRKWLPEARFGRSNRRDYVAELLQRLAPCGKLAAQNWGATPPMVEGVVQFLHHLAIPPPSRHSYRLNSGNCQPPALPF